MTETKKPTKEQAESGGVLSGKQELAGSADEKLRHMGEKTRQAAQDAPRSKDKPQKS